MTGLQSHSRLQHEISRTTLRQDGLARVEAASYRLGVQVDPRLHADERDGRRAWAE